MPLAQICHLARLAFKFSSILHYETKAAAELVLKMRRFAQFSTRDRSHMQRPAPSQLQRKSSDHTAANMYEFKLTPFKIDEGPASLPGSRFGWILDPSKID